MSDPIGPVSGGAPERVRLYAIHGSHPSLVASRALELKGIEYERVLLAFGPSMLQQKWRFGRRTVPGLQVGNARVCGSRMILRALEGLAPSPSLYPAEPEARRRHDAIERWGEECFQEASRWLLGLAFRTHPEVMSGYLEAGPPVPPAVMTRAVALEMRLLGRTLEYARGELAVMSAYVDRIDDWMAEGHLGSDAAPTAAGLQIGSTLAMLLTYEDLAPLIVARPRLESLARVNFPNFPGRIPAGVFEVT